MTTFELKRSILQYINALMDDEAAMRRISRYIRRLRNSTSTKDVLLQYTTIKIAQLINKAFVLDNSDMIYRKTVVDIILLQLLIRHNTNWDGTIVTSLKHNTP